MLIQFLILPCSGKKSVCPGRESSTEEPGRKECRIQTQANRRLNFMVEDVASEGSMKKRMTPYLISGIENSADANETFGTKGNHGFV